MTEGTIGDFWTKVDPRHLGILLGCSHGGTLFPHNFPTSLPLRTLYHISMYCFKCYFCLLADRGYFPDAFFSWTWAMESLTRVTRSWSFRPEGCKGERPSSVKDARMARQYPLIASFSGVRCSSTARLMGRT